MLIVGTMGRQRAETENLNEPQQHFVHEVLRFSREEELDGSHKLELVDVRASKESNAFRRVTAEQ